MSMTPERTFKLLTGSELIVGQNILGLRMFEDGEHVEFPVDAADVFDDVLAALVESQQQLTLERERTDYWGNKEEEARWEAAKWREDLIKVNKKLVEAQQTIARQQSALEVFADKYAWFVTKGGGIEWIGNVDPKDLALDALKGNKEGSDKA